MRNPDGLTNEILDRIIEKGLKGKLSPGIVLRVTKAELEPLVIEGKSDGEISGELDVSNASVFYLRKYYDLPGCKEARKMLACVEPEPTIEESLTGKTIEDVPTYTATEMPDTIDQADIINICMTKPGRIAYGIVAGVARMLKEMDAERVEVEVVVRRA